MSIHQHFNGIFVISLPESRDRRAHIERSFRRRGLADYVFVDGVTPDAPEVEEAYETGRVKHYPPCFRCGQTGCACPNNVLVPAQVATFFSHAAAWRQVAQQQPGYYLIVEDDVVFQWYAGYILDQCRRNGRLFLEREREEPVLIRLGWAKSKQDHRFRFRGEVLENAERMSNPAYAITPALATILLEQFREIATTADIFLHRQVGRGYRNYTVLPAVATELSWSSGTVSSLIHPREQRLRRISGSSNAAIQQELQRYEEHVQYAVERKILGVGHPRTGSGFLSETLKALGLDVGHEAMGEDGIVSWMFTVYDLNAPWALNKYAKSRYFAHFAVTIKHVRDPYSAIPSVIRENEHAPRSLAYRRKHLLKHCGIDLDRCPNPLEKASLSLILWDRAADAVNTIDHVFRIEDGSKALVEFLKSKGMAGELTGPLPAAPANKDKHYNQQKVDKPDVGREDWERLSTDTKGLLNGFCERYGYPAMFGDAGELLR
ncbi:MAG: glycosyltransferase family 25 protein [Methylococcaceae bacterium]|nr:glycosyltransferase family 25 protein [Methylococcaceae bacterium]